jgi:hypothetical protein
MKVHDDVMTLLGQKQRGGRTHAAGRATDQGHGALGFAQWSPLLGFAQ